ncbi:MAG: hypothetical protein HUU50_03160 [Candidatus Brocadiae bacterium]|nr:hypothetical protein [Candidatus Brocadiia bacterium]
MNGNSKYFLVYDTKSIRKDKYPENIFDFYLEQGSFDFSKYKAAFLHISEEQYKKILFLLREVKIPIIHYSGGTTHTAHYISSNEITINLSDMLNNLDSFCKQFYDTKKIDLNIFIYGKVLYFPPYMSLLQSLYLFLESGFQKKENFLYGIKEIVNIGYDIHSDLWNLLENHKGIFSAQIEESMKSYLDCMGNFLRSLEDSKMNSFPCISYDELTNFHLQLKKIFNLKKNIYFKNNNQYEEQGKNRQNEVSIMLFNIPSLHLPEILKAQEQKFFELSYLFLKNFLPFYEIERCTELENALEYISQKNIQKLVIFASSFSANEIDNILINIQLNSKKNYKKIPVLICLIEGKAKQLIKNSKFTKIWFSSNIHIINWNIPSLKEIAIWLNKKYPFVYSDEIQKELQIQERIQSLETEFRHDLRNENGFLKIIQCSNPQRIDNKQELEESFKIALKENKNLERFILYQKLLQFETSINNITYSQSIDILNIKNQKILENLKIFLIEDFSPWHNFFKSLGKTLNWTVDCIQKVEDEEKNDLRLLDDFLTKSGKFKEKFLDYDLIILDLRLKKEDHNVKAVEMSGFRILKNIRTMDFFIPVILFTSTHQLYNFRTLQPLQIQDIFIKDESEDNKQCNPFELLIKKIIDSVKKRQWLDHWHLLCELWRGHDEDQESFYYIQQAFYAIFYHTSKNELDTFVNPYHEAILSLKNCLDSLLDKWLENSEEKEPQEKKLYKFKYYKDFMSGCCFWLVTNFRNLVAHGMGNNLIGEEELDIALICVRIFLCKKLKKTFPLSISEKNELSSDKKWSNFEELWNVTIGKILKELNITEQWWGSFKANKGIMENIIDILGKRDKETSEYRKKASILLLFGEMLTSLSEEEINSNYSQILIHQILQYIEFDTNLINPNIGLTLEEQKKRLLVPNTEEKKKIFEKIDNLASFPNNKYALPSDIRNYGHKNFKKLQDE